MKPRNRALADSGFLFSLYDTASKRHTEAATLVRTESLQLLVPGVVLTETAFLFNRTGGVPAVVNFLDSLIVAQMRLEPVTLDDLRRVREIMATYADSKLDFVDCCIMALSERLDVSQVCTFDRRDFPIFRPKHRDYLELLP